MSALQRETAHLLLNDRLQYAEFDHDTAPPNGLPDIVTVRDHSNSQQCSIGLRFDSPWERAWSAKELDLPKTFNRDTAPVWACPWIVHANGNVPLLIKRQYGSRLLLHICCMPSTAVHSVAHEHVLKQSLAGCIRIERELHGATVDI
eukprot:2883-Heterococcus_DN1.PRE.1